MAEQQSSVNILKEYFPGLTNKELIDFRKQDKASYDELVSLAKVALGKVEPT